jgi:hypothetical protein
MVCSGGRRPIARHVGQLGPGGHLLLYVLRMETHSTAKRALTWWAVLDLNQ